MSNKDAAPYELIIGGERYRRVDLLTPEEKMEKALDIIIEYGGIDGEHHKTWVIDQVVRCLTDDMYEDFVINFCAGEDGPDTYEWDEGRAP